MVSAIRTRRGWSGAYVIKEVGSSRQFLGMLSRNRMLPAALHHQLLVYLNSCGRQTMLLSIPGALVYRLDRGQLGMGIV